MFPERFEYMMQSLSMHQDIEVLSYRFIQRCIQQHMKNESTKARFELLIIYIQRDLNGYYSFSQIGFVFEDRRMVINGHFMPCST